MTGWPWPLDGVQHWFEGLWQWISDIVWSGINWLRERLIEAQNWLRDRFNEGMSWLSDRLWEAMGWLRTQVETLSSFVSERVWGFITWLSEAVADKVNWLNERIWAGVTWIRDRANESAAWLNDRIWEGITWVRDRSNEAFQWINNQFWSGVSWVNDRLSEGWTWVNTQLSALGTTIISNFIRAFDDAASTIVNNIAKPLFEFAGQIWAKIKEGAMVLFTRIKEDIIDPLQPYFRAFWDEVTGYWRAGIQGLVNILVSPGHKTPEVAYNEMPTLMLQTTAMGLGVAGIIAVAQTKIAGTGLDLGPVQNIILPMIPSAMVATAYIGTAIQTGYVTALRYYFNQLYTPLIPGSGDLIRFVVREVITPEAFTNYMAYEGYSSEWADAYWRAHWVLPPLDRVYDAFHRGIVDEPFLRDFLVLADYEAKYHDLLIGTLYTLIPRVDLRYGWETGALNDEDLYGELRKQGFDDAGARTEVIIQKRRVLESELNTLRTETINDYVDGFIAEEVLRANLAATLLRSELVDARVAAAKLKRSRNERKERVAAYKTQYLRGGISVSEAISDLKSYTLTQEEAVSTVQDWEVLRKPTKIVETKKPEDDVLAQLTLNERYSKILEGNIEENEKKGVDVAEPKILLERGKYWTIQSGEELKAGRVDVALDIAKYTETVIKSVETILRRNIIKLLTGVEAA